MNMLQTNQDHTNSIVNYLVENFRVAQLREERRHARYKAEANDCFRGTPYFDKSECFWWWMVAQYDDAIKEIHQLTRKPPQSHPHYRNATDIKNSTDIVTMIESYTTLCKSGARFAGLCPLHDDNKSPSLMVYPDSQTWHCFGCNRGGDVISFIQIAEKTDFRGALAFLGGSRQ